MPIPESGIDVNFGKGYATLEAKNLPVLDYGNIINAIFGGGPPPVPATVSFLVEWKGKNQRVNIRNTDPVYGGFEGQFIYNTARMEWSATVGDLSIVSDPIGASSGPFALIGHERNGQFFK